MIFKENAFLDKVVLVTGGTRGIGKAISQSFLELGAKVIANYGKGHEKAKEFESEMSSKSLSSKLELSSFDVSQSEEVSKAIKDIESNHGRVDILINNAGISIDNLLVRFSVEDWKKVLDVNLTGAFNCMKTVSLGMMKRREGKIINISSVVGITGNAGQCAYSASKAGVIAMTKSAALELASRNVQINSVAPGYIETEMTQALPEKTKAQILERIPQKRIGQGQGVANLCLFLSSSASNYITGQSLVIDGGMVTC